MPRTNGVTEKFNGTLIDSLKKCIDENKEDWPKWIPFVLLAYRSKIHTTTKFSPYMFGKEINGFENYLLENHQSANDDLCLEKRVQEIKRQYENFMAKAFDNIEVAQTEQRGQQDARHKIIPEKLKIGT